MQTSQLKMMYFSLGKSSVKQLILDWKKMFALLSACTMVVLFILILILRLFTDFYNNWKIDHLKNENTHLEQKITALSKKVKDIDHSLIALENKDNDLRVFVDLPVMSSDMRTLGVGGRNQETYTDYSFINQNVLKEATQIEQMIDNVSQRIDLLSNSRNEIVKKYDENITQLKQTPSVRPLKTGRISDRFGYRIDPFTGTKQHHNGLDISAPRGTDVMATANGVVLEAVSKYTPNQLRGKYIIIDHGYGFMTKYAHLSKIFVKPGQYITRYTIIGKVGDTGRATGPHLHYEVIKDQVCENPQYYILD
ncbi:M23 family metallopeptidase [candidate division KSB1 bacterium]|nr:M23 family metallopeptidase [candidate division KSB1 bacterium]